MLTINIADISYMPAAFILGREFHYTNLCWVKTSDNRELELVFSEEGNPLTDIELLGKIENNFNKRFEQLRLGDDLIYGSIIKH